MTGTLVTVCRAEEVGLEEDHTAPWATLCEGHGAVLRSSTLKLARSAMAFPEWCTDCSKILDEKHPA